MMLLTSYVLFVLLSPPLPLSVTLTPQTCSAPSLSPLCNHPNLPSFFTHLSISTRVIPPPDESGPTDNELD